MDQCSLSCVSDDHAVRSEIDHRFSVVDFERVHHFSKVCATYNGDFLDGKIVYYVGVCGQRDSIQQDELRGNIVHQTGLLLNPRIIHKAVGMT